MILKLEFEVKKLVDGHQNSPLATWGALAWGSTVWWCSKKNVVSSIPSFNLSKFHSNSRVPSPKKSPYLDLISTNNQRTVSTNLDLKVGGISDFE